MKLLLIRFREWSWLYTFYDCLTNKLGNATVHQEVHNGLIRWSFQHFSRYQTSKIDGYVRRPKYFLELRESLNTKKQLTSHLLRNRSCKTHTIGWALHHSSRLAYASRKFNLLLFWCIGTHLFHFRLLTRPYIHRLDDHLQGLTLEIICLDTHIKLAS